MYTVYKLVQSTEDGQYFSAFVPHNSPLVVHYKLGELAQGKVGKLFVYNDKERAISDCLGMGESYATLMCQTESVEDAYGFEGLNIFVLNDDNALEECKKFWRNPEGYYPSTINSFFFSTSCKLSKIVVRGTQMCDSLTPVEVIHE